MIEPVIVKVETKKVPTEAFKFFTERMHQFWPMGHSIGETPRTDLVVELEPDGRWYEVCGEEKCDWGRVLEFTPGERILFAWHLNAEWEFDPETFTEVLVTFSPSSVGTFVTLTHSKLERYGKSAEAVRQSLGAETGWPNIIGAFADIS